MNIELVDSFEVRTVKLTIGGQPTEVLELVFTTWTDGGMTAKRTWPRLRLPQTKERDLLYAVQVAIDHIEKSGGPAQTSH